jgi:hypothetical protein
VERITSLKQKPYQSDYLLVDTVVDHPVGRVWTQVLDIGSWMDAHELVTLEGRSGQVGHFERVLPRGLGADVPEPHYHLYGVAKILPHRMLALEVIPERGGSYGEAHEWASFDTILLTDLNERTHLSFLMVDVNFGPGSSDSQKAQAEKVEQGRKLIYSYFDNLKALLSNG